MAGLLTILSLVQLSEFDNGPAARSSMDTCEGQGEKAYGNRKDSAGSLQ